MPGESSAVPTEDGVGLNYLETSPPARPESVQQNPQEPVAAVEAQRRGAFFWQTASWWRSARISACRAARVRKLEATKAKRATKRELIVVATMISRMIGTPVFSDRTEFSVSTATIAKRGATLAFAKIQEHLKSITYEEVESRYMDDIQPSRRFWRGTIQTSRPSALIY